MMTNLKSKSKIYRKICLAKLSNSQQQNWSDESLGWINFNPEINLSDENLEHEGLKNINMI